MSLTPSQLNVSKRSLEKRAQSGHHAAPYQSSFTLGAACALVARRNSSASFIMRVEQRRRRHLEGGTRGRPAAGRGGVANV